MRPDPAQATAGQQGGADWMALGTQARLVVTRPERLAAGCSLLSARLAAVDAACNRSRPDSELSVVNANAARVSGPMAVSPLLAEAIEVALRAAWLTGGDVDPTAARAIDSAGYDRDFSLVRPTGPPVRLTVRAVPGWRHVRLDRGSGQLSLAAGSSLDLGATAKAWAADRAATELAGQLSCGVLVSLGGDIAVAGRPPSGGWRIRVQDVTGRPEDPPGGPVSMVSIRAGGLATSAAAARRWRRGGNIMHHILDPRTGLSAASLWRTVSVAASSCVDASTASTAAIIKGAAAPGWLASAGLAARLVGRNGAVRTVAGWPPDTQAGG